jgi:hypothetical protein
MSEQIERYLQGRLTPSEEQAFEEAYLGDPDLLDRLMLTEKLQQGFKQSESPLAAAPQGRSAWRFWNTPQYAAAASIMLAATVLMSGLLYNENRSLREAGSGLAVNPILNFMPLVAVRGQADNEIAVPPPGQWAVLLVDPGFGDYDSFDAIVSRLGPDGDETVSQSTGLTVGLYDQLAVSVPSSSLTAGRYELVILGRGADWPESRAAEDAGRYTFAVR